MKKILVFSMLALSPVWAGIRGPGDYCGIVVRDRWGGMYLYSGVYLTYVSEKVKRKLANAVGRAVVVDVQRIYQPINPGDALIEKLRLLSRVPTEDDWVPVHDLSIHVNAAIDGDGRPQFLIQIENKGQREARLRADALGMTVLAQRPSNCDAWPQPGDGSSVALVTRQSFWSPLEGRVDKGQATVCGTTCSWILKRGGVDDSLVMMQPGEVREWLVALCLPMGEYEFFAGYGGGVHDSLGLASTQIAFDVEENGTAVIHAPTASPSNNRVNATVRPVTPLACASVAPVRPARYAVRYADTLNELDQ